MRVLRLGRWRTAAPTAKVGSKVELLPHYPGFLIRSGGSA